MKKDKKKLAVVMSILGIAAFSLPLFASAVEEIEDPSLLTPEIEQEMEEYSAGITKENTFEGDFTETLPFFNDQFNQFSLELSKNNRRSYRAGDRLDMLGSLTFTSTAESSYLDFKKNCLESLSGQEKSRCLLSPTYFFKHYPETGIFVQIWQKDRDEKGALSGDYLIDEFYALNGFDLKEGEKKDFAINWKTPPDLENGDYYLTFSVLNNQAFELSGSPLLAGAPKTVYDFKITNGAEKSSGVKIDKNGIKINGVGYSYRAPAPEIKPEAGENSINVELPILNGEGENKVSLRYELYRWSQTDPKNLIDSREESLYLKANEQSKVSYKFDPGQLESVYSLKIVAKAKDSISTSNVRFVIKNRSKAIFRFLSLAGDRSGNYPFFCLKNANWSGIFQGTVQIELKDSIGNLINSASQKTNIRPETRCFIALDNKVESNECLVLKAKISDRNGKPVDEKEFILPCGNDKNSRIGSTLQKISDSVALKDNKGWILIFVFILFILIGGFIHLNNKKKNDEN